MSIPRPRREDQQDPGVLDRRHLMPLGGVEDREQPRAARRPLAIGGIDLDIAVDHQHPGALVDLMLLELLALRQVDDDGATLGLGIEDLWGVRLHVEFVEVPALHHAGLYIRAVERETVRCARWSSRSTAPPGPASQPWLAGSRRPSASPTWTRAPCIAASRWRRSSAASIPRTASGWGRWPGISTSTSAGTPSASTASPSPAGSARRRSPSPPRRSPSTPLSG